MAETSLRMTTLTNHNNTIVSKETAKPKKPKRKDRSDLGPDFVAPDGGWGWVVCFATGFSNFSLFSPLQQFGLIYRERFSKYDFDAKQTTTILNVKLALSSLVGIVNGAMFRRFTFRQVALVGSLLVFIGIFLSAFSETFIQYLACFSCIYGIGFGFCMTANSLAVNTYFKNKRRKATGFSWTLTGLGSIIFPHVSTLLLAYYGAQGSILVYSALILNCFLCSLTLQPVLWHVRKPDMKRWTKTHGNNIQNFPKWQCEYCQYQNKGQRTIFSSQYLFNDDDPDKPGYEITEPATPMLARANDGWFGSKGSFGSEKDAHNRKQEDKPERPLFKPNYFNREKEDINRYASKVSLYSKTDKEEFHCTCAEERTLLQSKTNEMKKQEEGRLGASIEEDELKKSHKNLGKKIVRFFDLDLLRDFTFVNLAAGMSIMMFGEINFSILTPFILNSFGYSDHQISLAMSLLASMDIAVRFLAPFALETIKLGNRALFALGIIAISIGRMIVAFTNSYHVIMVMFVLIGFGKGLRTIFSPLIIPSYVPLKRLPAASGLQLICNSIFSFALGPLLGLITDRFGYAVSIHFINGLTCASLLVWFGESIIRKFLKTNRPPIDT